MINCDRDFDAWFNNLSIEEQREYVEDMEADYALMWQFDSWA